VGIYEKSIPYNVYCITSNTVGITATLFIPPLEGGNESDGSKMYITESSQVILPSPGGRERGRGITVRLHPHLTSPFSGRGNKESDDLF